MRIDGLVWSGIVFVLAGCAHQDLRFAGRAPNLRGPEAEAVWRADSTAPGGHRNRAVVRAIRGHAQVSFDKGKSWKDARVGMGVQANGGLTVEKKRGSSVDLYLGENGPVIRALANSELNFERLDLLKRGDEKVIDTRIELRRGEIQGAVKQLAPESTYLIRTRTGLIRVRGAEFAASADGGVKVVKGRAEVLEGANLIAISSGEVYVRGKGVRKITRDEAGEVALIEDDAGGLRLSESTVKPRKPSQL